MTFHRFPWSSQNGIGNHFTKSGICLTKCRRPRGATRYLLDIDTRNVCRGFGIVFLGGDPCQLQSRPNTQEKYLGQLLEQKIFPAVKVVENLRSSCISFTSWQQRRTAVFTDELIHQPWDTLIGLNPVAISATKHCISEF